MHAQDSALFMSLNEYVGIVKKYHPIALQADINIEKQRSFLLQQRAAFDPTIQANTQKKDIENVTYYQYNRAELNIPTWYGIDIVSGVENVTGANTNPELSKSTYNYTGLQMNLLQNVIMDKRRAYIRIAQNWVSLSEQQKLNTYNELLHDAIVAYYDWVQAYNEWQIFKMAVSNSKERVNFTKQSILLGDRPAIDSIEAITQLQYFESMELNAKMNYEYATLSLSYFTWWENNSYYNLPANVVPKESKLYINNPSENKILTEEDYIETAMKEHPELQMFNYKFAYLKLNKQLAIQELLPEVKLKYNFLSKGYFINENTQFTPLENNFQYGLSFKMPLRLSKGRGMYKNALLDIQQTQYDFDLKKRAISIKIKQAYNNYIQTINQYNLHEKMLDNFSKLLLGENVKFKNGESSLFLMNSREQKKIEAELKLLQTYVKFNKYYITLLHNAGILYQNNF